MRSCGNVQNAAVLNISSRADANVIDVASDNGTEPDARIFTDFNIADDDSRFGDINRLVNFRSGVLERRNHFSAFGKTFKLKIVAHFSLLKQELEFSAESWQTRIKYRLGITNNLL
jgi:hypothetical protein